MDLNPTLQRIPEPELMNDAEQARAYAEADFSAPHNHFVALFKSRFPHGPGSGPVLDLGCGPADITLRFARAFPDCPIDGIDGAPAMLELGIKAIRAAGLQHRIRLVQGYLPGAKAPESRYGAVISNSLLHHLADPAVLWQSILCWSEPGAAIFVMDLMRPSTAAEVARLVETYAGAAPEILQRDFSHSLCAAYRPDEIRQQLAIAGLAHLAVDVVSDRHLVISGTL
jgi:ubiquinone/menaquinone biosynthesis C-methylase UbiE